jgi:hypothetical protein
LLYILIIYIVSAKLISDYSKLIQKKWVEFSGFFFKKFTQILRNFPIPLLRQLRLQSQFPFFLL